LKLKYKLFLSYFFLIVLFSFSLFWLLIEIRELTLSLQNHVQQDVRSIIDLSGQLQTLEDLNANYILLFIPTNANEKIVRLEQSRHKYAQTWEQLKSRLTGHKKRTGIDILSGKFYRLILKIVGENLLYSSKQPIAQLIEETDRRWREVDSRIKQSVKNIRARQFTKARYLRDVYVKNKIQDLRKSLVRLNKVIGRQSIERSLWMSNIAQKTQSLILFTELSLLIIALLTAFLVARKITKPIEVLKDSVNRMAIHDFEVVIPDKPNDEIGDLSSAFEQFSRRLKETDRFKSAMLSQFTHEMKSPLGSIKQATQLLEKSLNDRLSATQRRFLDIIKGNYQTLQRMITNILHTTAYDIGQIQLKYQKVNLVKLVAEQLIYLSPTIKEKEIKVNINFSSKKIEAELDAEKFKEVVQNLITNAVKFSSANTQIDVKLKEKFPLIRFSIKDQGIGIPEKEIPYIFEKMYRASNSEKISVKGTGLGLYITSQIVRAHGGRIQVKSEINKGTEFTVVLPKNRTVAKEGGWLDDSA